MRSKIILVCSFLLTGCGVGLPDTNLCLYSKIDSKKFCLNMATDYNLDGTPKAGAVLKEFPVNSLDDLDGNLVVDEPGQINLKVWAAELRTKRAGH